MHKRVYFDYLDSLRFFAFFAVFVAHTAILFPISADWFYSLYRNVITNGSYGVNFFFILSGFLISYLLLAEKKETGEVSIRTFYMKRVLRIWPLYFVVFIISVFILPFMVRILGANYIEGSLHTFPNLGMAIGEHGTWWFFAFIGNFYRAYDFGHIPFALGVLWSVCVEEQFYLFWPWIVKKFSHRGVLYVSLIIFGISLVYKAIHINDANIAYYSTFSVAMDLAAGCTLGVLYFLREKEIRSVWRTAISSMKNFQTFNQNFMKSWNMIGKYFNNSLLRFHRYSKNKKTQVIISAILCISLIIGIFGYISITLMQGGDGLVYDSLRLLKRPVLNIIFVIFLLAFLLRKPRELVEGPNTDISTSASAYKPASNPWYNRFTYLGRISYGLYSYHAIFLILVLALFNNLGMGPNDVSVFRFCFVFLLSLLLTVIASHYSYKWMEGPCIRLRSKFVKGNLKGKFRGK